MRYQRFGAAGLAGALVLAGLTLAGAAQGLPVFKGRPIVARVNDDVISLDMFLAERGPDADVAALRQGLGTAADLALLDRLVTVKLVAAEGATMGLDELPEIQKQVEVTAREILREQLFARVLKNVKPDPAAVDRQFRNLVREWKTSALLFQDEAAAKRVQKELAAGAVFKDVATREVAARAAKSDADDAYHGRKDYLPQIADALTALKVGQVSPVIRLGPQFVVIKVVDIRYPEDRAARAEATRAVLNVAQQAALKAHEESLRRSDVVINTALLKGLDFEAPKPGIDALLKDTRIVAQIKGGASVTVGDLTDYLRMQFFHGDDKARQQQEMNAKKEAALNATIGRRVLNMEAQKLGLDRTDAYRERVAAYKESLVFGAFMDKVIAPDNKMREEEVRQYYERHLSEYSYPAMMRIQSLAFTGRDGAEAAMQKLQEGADYNWVATNAGGQADRATPGLLTFGNQPVTITSMPDGVRKALAGVKTGDRRLYASPGGPVYVLAVQQLVGASPKPYQDVRDEIAKKLYAEKLEKALDEYVGKLRARSKVETYLKRIQ